MAILSKDGLTMGISDISSYYPIDDALRDTYESFYLVISIQDEEILSELSTERFEFVAGNLIALINGIHEALEGNGYQEIEFLEPDVSFELFPLDKEGDLFRFCWWINSGVWEEIHSTTHVGCRMQLSKNELKEFVHQLYQEWLQRARLPEQ